MLASDIMGGSPAWDSSVHSRPCPACQNAGPLSNFSNLFWASNLGISTPAHSLRGLC